MHLEIVSSDDLKFVPPNSNLFVFVLIEINQTKFIEYCRVRPGLGCMNKAGLAVALFFPKHQTLSPDWQTNEFVWILRNKF